MSTTTLRLGEHTLLFNVSDGIIFSQLQPTPYFFRNTGDRIILHCPESTLCSLQWGYRLPKGFQFGQEPASDREMNNRLDYNAHIGKQTNVASNPAATFLRPSGRQMPWACLQALGVRHYLSLRFSGLSAPSTGFLKTLGWQSCCAAELVCFVSSQYFIV